MNYFFLNKPLEVEYVFSYCVFFPFFLICHRHLSDRVHKGVYCVRMPCPFCAVTDTRSCVAIWTKCRHGVWHQKRQRWCLKSVCVCVCCAVEVRNNASLWFMCLYGYSV